MTYEKFINISTNLKSFIKTHRNVFISFGHLLNANLITEDDIEYFRDIKSAFLKAQPCKPNPLNIDIVVCMIIILKFPNETFENANSEMTKVSYLVSRQFKYSDQIWGRDLLLEGTLLNDFMMSVV